MQKVKEEEFHFACRPVFGHNYSCGNAMCTNGKMWIKKKAMWLYSLGVIMISFWRQQGPAGKPGADIDPRMRPKHQLTIGDLGVKIRLTEGTLGSQEGQAWLPKPKKGRHGCGEGPSLGAATGPGSAGTMARAVGSWRPAPLQWHWLPWSVTWGPGPWAGCKELRGGGQDQGGLVVPS